MKKIITVVDLSGSLLFGLSLFLLIAGCTESRDPQSSGNGSAQVQLEGRRSISSQELQQAVAEGQELLLLDVRSAGEYESGHIPGAVNISHEKVIASPDDVPGRNDKAVVVYCASGYRAGKARAALLQAGFQNVLHLEGDMGKWRSNGLPLEVDE